MHKILGIDFGTTNSVVAELAPDGAVHSRVFRFGAAELDVFRTVLCFWNEIKNGRDILHHAAGPAAIDTYLEDPGNARLIMSMKTYLAQRSFTQTRIYGRITTLEQMIAVFLRKLLGPAEENVKITAGRPVRFAGDFADSDFGEARLRAAYAEAGYPSIDTALEPQAAGYRFTRTLDRPATVLVGDFGGGTSDFSLLRFTPGAAVESLGYGGIGLAGDHFDFRIIDNAVSPLLGKGGTYNIMGNDLPIPIEYYAGFARWHRLSLMRTPKMLRDIEEVARKSTDPAALRHLIGMIEEEAGYLLYQRVSQVKAALSKAPSAQLQFEHEGFVLDRTVTRQDFEAWIAPDLARIAACVDQLLENAGIGADAVDRVFLTGGTSFVPAVQRIFTDRFGPEKLSSGGEFVSVAEGLALISQEHAAPAP